MIAPNAPPQLRHWSSGCIHKEASFVSLDDLDKISVLLDEDNDLEEEITHLFNEISIFISKFEKNTANQALNLLKTCALIRGNVFKYDS